MRLNVISGGSCLPSLSVTEAKNHLPHSTAEQRLRNWLTRRQWQQQKEKPGRGASRSVLQCSSLTWQLIMERTGLIHSVQITYAFPHCERWFGTLAFPTPPPPFCQILTRMMWGGGGKRVTGELRLEQDPKGPGGLQVETETRRGKYMWKQRGKEDNG